MARPESGKKVMGWAAAAAMLAAAPLVTACGSHSSDASSGDSPSPSSSASSSSDASSGGGPGAKPGGQSSVSAAASTWVNAVLEKDAKQACLVSEEPGSGSHPKATTAQTCSASMLKKLAPGLKAMSTAFTPQNSPGKHTVKTDVPTPKGDSAVVPSAKITVDGKPLRAIILSRSHGMDQKSFTAKMKADKIDGKWYVGDFNMNGGNQTLQPQGQ